MVSFIKNYTRRSKSKSLTPIFVRITGFKGQTEVLARLFQLVTANAIKAPLYDPAKVAKPGMNNKEFLYDYVSELMQNAFPHLKRSVSS